MVFCGRLNVSPQPGIIGQVKYVLAPLSRPYLKQVTQSDKSSLKEKRDREEREEEEEEGGKEEDEEEDGEEGGKERWKGKGRAGGGGRRRRRRSRPKDSDEIGGFNDDEMQEG
ncbi:hypothetical protein HZH66_006500 [Vespula vulgaris]|uniref:Uncharacterized protein n=1 Tax=Vespula vulgaris TaxID=7454 RepID=A0A834K1M8_VESVU|nr:hypothetical protein HZH66_006500 [Vespula vulgaris]